MDISLTLNDDAKISLEMQVINEHNWPERSLSYLCRSFDHLSSGDKYADIKPTIQISILDFTLFPKHPEFYATYKFLNVKNHTLYSDKLRLSVLDLTHIDLATEEDNAWQLDYWAALFKTKTWEDLKMLTEKNEFIQNAAETVYKLTQEEEIRLQCQAREDYYRNQRDIQHQMDTLKKQLEEQNKLLAEQNKINETLSKENQILKNQLKQYSSPYT